MNADRPSVYPAPPNLPFHVANTLGNMECWVRWSGVTLLGHFRVGTLRPIWTLDPSEIIKMDWISYILVYFTTIWSRKSRNGYKRSPRCTQPEQHSSLGNTTFRRKIGCTIDAWFRTIYRTQWADFHFRSRLSPIKKSENLRTRLVDKSFILRRKMR